jgi:hypothetical protein
LVLILLVLIRQNSVPDDGLFASRLLTASHLNGRHHAKASCHGHHRAALPWHHRHMMTPNLAVAGSQPCDAQPCDAMIT